MIATDSSSLIAYFDGEKGADVDLVETILEQRQMVLPPVVLSELLSDPKVSKDVKDLFQQIPLLTVTEGYWERVGLLRAKLLAKGLKARLADSLISQSCLDHSVPLITRDPDFRHFSRLAGLKLLP